MAESLQRSLPGRWILNNDDVRAINQLICMGWMAADHLQRKAEKPHLIHEGRQPDPSSGMRQESFVLAHAPAFSTAEQTRTQRQQANSPHNFIQPQSIPTTAVTTTTQQNLCNKTDHSDQPE